MDTVGTSADIPADDDEALRKRLLSRIAVAGVIIVGLLGGLAVFDSLNRPQQAALPKMAAVPPASQPARQEPAEAPAEAPVKEGEEAAQAAAGDEEGVRPAESEAVPERSVMPLAPPPVAKPLTLPATPRAAAIRPSEPALAGTSPDVRREAARGIPEGTRPPQAGAARPLTRPGEGGESRFLVQVGVFGNYANAEDLLQKLQAAGIPAQIESRVQVGPFASRAEADAARVKLRALGIDDGLLVRR